MTHEQCPNVSWWNLESLHAGRWEGGRTWCARGLPLCMPQGSISMATGAHCAETLQKECVELGRGLLKSQRPKSIGAGKETLGPQTCRQARQAEVEVPISESRAQGQDPHVRSKGVCPRGTGLILTIACVGSVSRAWSLTKDLDLGLTRVQRTVQERQPSTSVRESGRSRLGRSGV